MIRIWPSVREWCGCRSASLLSCHYGVRACVAFASIWPAHGVLLPVLLLPTTASATGGGSDT